jgi:hypothetical protein
MTFESVNIVRRACQLAASSHRLLAAACAGLVLLSAAVGLAASGVDSSSRSSHGLSYQHDEIQEGPWSIHIVRIERSNPDFELHTALANGTRLGLTTLSEQIKSMPPNIGRPVAGVNGDFFRKNEPCMGDPKGLQIMRGELVSGPCDWSCFWIDPDGEPHMTNVISRFQAVWPDGQRTPFGLNEVRTRNSAVLYTSAVGASTETAGGRELILERHGTNTWLPLRAGVTYSARVKEVRETGNSLLTDDTIVLSLSPQIAGQVPAVPRGTVLQLSTATWPDLKGVQAAIGGGPPLVRGGRALQQETSRVRHPRAGVGWNKDYVFLVEVDGRQRSLSVGMTMAEFADYMAKLGCAEALNLDGGASATCWVYGLVMNSPSSGAERRMGNSLVVVQKEKK